MNFSAFERAQVAAFAYREGRRTGSIDIMRAVCFVLRNRVRNGWGDGTWLTVLAQSHLTTAGFEPFVPGEIAPVNPAPVPEGGIIGSAITQGFRSDDRLLQMIVRDVDDIYYGQERFDDQVRQVCNGENGAKKTKPALYYSFVDRTARPWFAEHIIQDHENHPQIGQIGMMMLYR